MNDIISALLALSFLGVSLLYIEVCRRLRGNHDL